MTKRMTNILLFEADTGSIPEHVQSYRVIYYLRTVGSVGCINALTKRTSHLHALDGVEAP